MGELYLPQPKARLGQMTRSEELMISVLFFSGLLGSLGHCLGMCGPLILMVGAPFRNLSWPKVLPRYLFYHGARISVYALLGILAGGFSSLVGISGRHTSIGGIFSILLGAGIILLGLGYIGWLPLGRLEGSSAWIGEQMKRALKRGGWLGLASLGALNGFLPCGLVYSALLAAASSGSPAKGGIAMAAFGAGTIPALIILGLGAGALNVRIRQFMVRAAGLLIVLVGLQLILRGSAGLGWVSHWKPGGFMIF